MEKIQLIRIVGGAVVGGLLGFLMYRFVGCRTGACPLTGNPYIAIILWAFMGALIMAGK